MRNRESDELRQTIEALRLPDALRQARLGRVVRWRYYRENPERRAGVAQAAGMNRARSGEDVAPDSGPTLIGWLAERLGRSSGAVKALLTRGTHIPVSVLKALGRRDDLKAMGGLLDRLATAYIRARGEVDWALVVEEHINGPTKPVPNETLLLTGAVQLMCLDSRLMLSELATKQPAIFDLVLVDPPYGIARNGAAGEMADDRDGATWCVPYLAKLIKPGRALCLWTSTGVVGKWAKALLDAGLVITDLVVWDKMDPYAASRTDEMMLVASTGTMPETFNDDSAKRWALPTLPKNHWLYTVHPSPKPPALMARVLARYSKPGDVVLDAFMGTAPVGVAAVHMGRAYVGYDAEPRFFQVGRGEVTNALVDIGEYVPGRAAAA